MRALYATEGGKFAWELEGNVAGNQVRWKFVKEVKGRVTPSIVGRAACRVSTAAVGWNSSLSTATPPRMSSSPKRNNRPSVEEINPSPPNRSRSRRARGADTRAPRHDVGCGDY